MKICLQRPCPALQAYLKSQSGILFEVSSDDLTYFVFGQVHALDTQWIAQQPAVIQLYLGHEYPCIARNTPDEPTLDFTYRGLSFDSKTLHLFAGLCAVDNRQNVEKTYQALQALGIQTTRMGAYKPRTNPYSFQGLGRTCLPDVFELAGRYDIQAIAMEVTCEQDMVEIIQALDNSGHPTGVIFQIGTRNAQNFHLLKAVGSQTTYPILYKRGFGNTLVESLNAVEYIAQQAGNQQLIYCFRGIKSFDTGDHRNFVDYTQIPILKRLTRLLICVDPSHSVGHLKTTPDGLTDVAHVTAQGLISGANHVLVDCHPSSYQAYVDAHQALDLEALPAFSQDCHLVHQTYQHRVQQAKERTC